MNRYRRFAKPLRLEMVEKGLFDTAQWRMRNWLVGITMTVAIVAFVLTIITVSIAGPRGMWPVLFLPLGVTLASSIMCVFWLTFAPLTAQGQQEAAQWKVFSRALKENIQRREPLVDTAMFGNYLIYAASLGFVERWVKYFQKQGVMDVPPWFHSLATARTDNMAAFVTMVAATHTAGSASGASGGGGGVAGGGASGAG